MKFCFIIPNLDGGGAQRVLLTFTEKLLARGHEVTLIVFDDTAEYTLPEGTRLVALGSGGLHGGWLNKKRLAYRLRRAFAGLEKNGKFDFASSSLPFADEVVYFSGLPNIWRHVHNTLSREVADLSVRRSPRKANRRRRRYQVQYAGQNILAVSQGVAADLTNDLGAKPANIEVIYNPFDFDVVQRLAEADVPGIPREAFLLNASRFMPQKRHDVLLDAYKLSGLPHKLVLLNAPAPELSQMIAERGLEDRVIVAGFQKNPYPWYRRAAAFALSSDYEGFGNVLVESLICGTPVVSTNCASGPSEILRGALAEFLSPPGDAAALAANLRKVVTSPPEIPRDILTQFSAEKVTGDLESLAARSRAAQ